MSETVADRTSWLSTRSGARSWDVDVAEFGEHPAVVLSTNAPKAQLEHAAVLVVTGTTRPTTPHLPVTADVGLTRCDESYVDITTRPTPSHPDLRPRRPGRNVGSPPASRLGAGDQRCRVAEAHPVQLQT